VIGGGLQVMGGRGGEGSARNRSTFGGGQTKVVTTGGGQRKTLIGGSGGQSRYFGDATLVRKNFTPGRWTGAVSVNGSAGSW
jgi:hypothetical protein